MTVDLDREDFTLGVVGAGAMGRGIAQVAAAGGIAVRLYDVDRAQSEDAIRFIERMLARAAEKGRMKPEDASAAVARIAVIETPADFAPCRIVIEAATENLEIKHKIYAELEKMIAEDAIIASNTSSLSITTLASKLSRPQRFAGMHFFNPVPLMKLVEVIDGMLTDPSVGDTLMELGRRMTREPVRVKDAPGFLVNQVGRGYNIEAVHIYAECIADYPDIDRILHDAVGFRMGPFALLDLTAIDVTHPATELIYEQFYHEPRFRPSPILRARLEAGLLGRKVGQGFYRYEDGKQIVPEEMPPPPYDGRKVWISRAEPDGHAALREIVEKIGAPIDDGERPDEDSIILVTPIGDDVTTAAVREGLDAGRTLGVDTVMGLAVRRTLVTNPATTREYRDAAHGLLAGDGVPVTVIRDCPGFVCQRIISTICNIGCQIAQYGIATPEDIDKAVVLGLNYPSGPLSFGDKVGPAKVLRILESMYRIYGDPRYRPCPWLRRRAELGLSLFTQEI